MIEVDPRLVKLLDVDMRIVMTWDADMTDIDLLGHRAVRREGAVLAPADDDRREHVA